MNKTNMRTRNSKTEGTFFYYNSRKLGKIRLLQERCRSFTSHRWLVRMLSYGALGNSWELGREIRVSWHMSCNTTGTGILNFWHYEVLCDYSMLFMTCEMGERVRHCQELLPIVFLQGQAKLQTEIIHDKISSEVFLVPPLTYPWSVSGGK